MHCHLAVSYTHLNKIERVATGSFGGDGVNYLNISQSEISNNVINVDSSPYGTVGIRTAAKRNVGESPVENILISNNTITGSANPLGFGSDDSPDISALRDITIVDNVINTSGGVVGEGMAQISGTAVFSGNHVEATREGALGLQLWFWNPRTTDWTCLLYTSMVALMTRAIRQATPTRQQISPWSLPPKGVTGLMDGGIPPQAVIR